MQRTKIKGLEGIHVATDERDLHLGQRGKVTVSTVASAKGYDAYCVLLASANEFPVDVKGRASFYVGCTRAIEYLEVTGYSVSGLLEETQHATSRRSR
jgi:superfamily I DNA/RNA helicase